MFVDWKREIIEPLRKILGRDYIFRLPSYAVKTPPDDGLPMMLLSMDELCDEMEIDEIDEPLVGKKRGRHADHISISQEYYAREQYNKDISRGNARVTKYIGMIKSAYIHYVSFHGIYPINNQPNKPRYCFTCNESFTSRNKLFRHLHQTGHHYELDINKLSI